jgi:hypothetical protein
MKDQHNLGQLTLSQLLDRRLQEFSQYPSGLRPIENQQFHCYVKEMVHID